MGKQTIIESIKEWDVLLAEIKEAVAVNYGYRVEMPTKWDYAMSVVCRTKKQLEMYEAVISKLLIDADVREKIALVAENKKLKMMIDNGLGWEDMTNDIAPMQER